MSFSPKNILIIGAGHGLGLGLAKEALKRYPQANIFTTYRREEKASELLSFSIHSKKIDPLKEEEVEKFCEELDTLDLVINAVGMLQTENNFGPEKSLRDMDLSYMTKIFQVNTFVTPLWGKYLKRKFSRDNPSIFSTLSAMVGSIDENKIGGWYSYRASKTALNMYLKTMAIEFERAHLKTTVVALHPGTTRTELSQDFLSGIKHQIWTPETAASNILNVLEGVVNEGGYHFLNWDGRKILS